MKTHYFISLAATVLLAGCEGAEYVPESISASGIDAGTTVLTVGIAPVSKTYMGDDGTSAHKVYWSDGDQIAVNGAASEALSGLTEDTQTASFTFDAVLTAPYSVLYPASVWEDDTHVTLPATQDWADGTFADGMNPMAGYSSDGTSISLSHLAAVLKISVLRAAVSADEDNLVAVRFKGGASEQVSGTFSIDYQNAALAPATGSGNDLEVRAVNNLETSTSTPAVYYLVVPARTYASGFSVTVQDADGHIMTKGKSGPVTLDSGKLYNLAEFEFVPTGTETGIEISSAEDLVNFASAYNSKTYEEQGEGLVATLTSDITFDAATSASFNATGGIGVKDDADVTRNYYFNGLFNGGGHTISGLDATVPLFAAVGSAGTVKDFTVDAASSFTFSTTTRRVPISAL